MSSDLLGIGVTGLKVAQAALNTTGHNISNAGVPGYSRQTVHANTNPANVSSGGFVGNGVSVESIEREVNNFVTEQLRKDTTLSSGLSSFHHNISQLDSLLSDASTGLSGAFNSFFSSMHNGADDPTSIPARQLIVSEANNLADRFSAIYGRVKSIEEGVDSALRSSVSELNTLASNIAQLNQKISDAMGSSIDNPPNDLLDQRDETLKKLSEIVSIQTYDQGFGQVNVIIGNGQNLVVGTSTRSLHLQPSETQADKFEIAFDESSGGQIITDSLSGGELGGLIQFRDTTMAQTYNDLGRIAIVVADTFNADHQNGVSLINEFGGDFFHDVNDESVAQNRIISHSDNLNSGNKAMFLNISDSLALTTDEYHLAFDQGGLFHITRGEGGEEVATGILSGDFPVSVEFDGLELVFESGTYSVGDSFSLQGVKHGAKDFDVAIINPEDIAFGSPLITDSSIGNLGSGNISSGEVLSLYDENGEALPLLANAGEMSPPLIVVFTSDTSYDVLNNSDPGNPVQLDPPIRNQRFIPGISNAIFPSDIGETMISTNGDFIGLPDGRLPIIGGGESNNNYPSELIRFSRPSPVTGASPIVEDVVTPLHASAKQTASVLNNINGVTATASNFIEISNTDNLSLADPLQIGLNGEDLIEYTYNSTSGLFELSAGIPDPALDPDGFNDYIALQINENDTLVASGISAVAGVNELTGASEIRVFSSQGDDFDLVLTADNATLPADSLRVSDGMNPTIALEGNGAGVTSAITIGGKIDIQLADGLDVETLPSDSLLFGDSTASDFSQSTFLGVQATLTGQPQKGDTFTLDFNVDAASDNRNARAMADLETLKTMDNGVSSFSDSYGVLVETIGIDTASAKINSDAADQVLDQTQQLRDSVSGVNLDEEAAKLIRYEQMYTANTQVISVARDLFDRLLGSF